FSSRRRHTRSKRDWSSDVCSSDLFHIFLPVPEITPPLLFKKRGCPDSKSQIRNSSPITDIVSAFFPFLCVIGNFVPFISVSVQNLFCPLIHLPFGLFIRQGRMVLWMIRLFIPIPKQRSFLQNQTVRRDMLRTKTAYPFQCLLITFQCLARNR